MSTAPSSSSGSVSRAAVTAFLLFLSLKTDEEKEEAQKSKSKTKYYAVLDGRPVRGRRPPFIMDCWGEAGDSVIGYKPQQEYLSSSKAVYFKSFKKLDEAVDFIISGYSTSTRDDLLKHIVSQQ